MLNQLHLQRIQSLKKETFNILNIVSEKSKLIDIYQNEITEMTDVNIFNITKDIHMKPYDKKLLIEVQLKEIEKKYNKISELLVDINNKSTSLNIERDLLFESILKVNSNFKKDEFYELIKIDTST